ncbi:MAG: LamG-like jellyroll fold domain-containing protein, partial [Pirellulales bacterium]
MNWRNARFTALMTCGEKHLRKEVGLVNPTETSLNLGPFDWTLEFWYLPTRTAKQEGVVLEIGSGPRGENGQVTQLALDPDRQNFKLNNQPSGNVLVIPSSASALSPARAAWHHLAFVYAAAEKQLRHYVDGIPQPLPEKCALVPLPHGKEAYLSVGRDSLWGKPLPGRIDELRISTGQVYGEKFSPPGSFATPRPAQSLLQGPPLLFAAAPDDDDGGPIALAGRKHVFIDDALLAENEGCEFVVNPPRKAERVIDRIEGSFRKHLTVVEDSQGLIRIYNGVENDYLAVRTSTDGVHFGKPETSRTESTKPTGQQKNQRQDLVVIPEMVGGLGNPFLDPNGPAEQRWKYFSGYHRRGIYLYTSADGYHWQRHKTATLSFRSGTQSCTFYDDQRQCYVSYHRSGIFHTPAGATQRSSVLTQHQNLAETTPFTPLTQAQYLALRGEFRLRDPLPWYLDNGPLTPGGFGMEFPHRFGTLPEDPVGTDIYI